MITKILYRTIRLDGGVSVTPNKPTDENYTETYRLMADDGMILTDGVNKYTCIDTDEPNVFKEMPETVVEEYAAAGKILMGVSE